MTYAGMDAVHAEAVLGGDGGGDDLDAVPLQHEQRLSQRAGLPWAMQVDVRLVVGHAHHHVLPGPRLEPRRGRRERHRATGQLRVGGGTGGGGPGAARPGPGRRRRHCQGLVRGGHCGLLCQAVDHVRQVRLPRRRRRRWCWCWQRWCGVARGRRAAAAGTHRQLLRRPRALALQLHLLQLLEGAFQSPDVGYGLPNYGGLVSLQTSYINFNINNGNVP